MTIVPSPTGIAVLVELPFLLPKATVKLGVSSRRPHTHQPSVNSREPHDVDDYADCPKHHAIHRMVRATRSVGGRIDRPALPRGRRKERGESG